MNIFDSIDFYHVKDLNKSKNRTAIRIFCIVVLFLIIELKHFLNVPLEYSKRSNSPRHEE